MASIDHLMLRFSSHCHRNGVLEEQRRGIAVFALSGAGFRRSRVSQGLRRRRREIVGYGRLQVTESQTVDGQVQSTVEIPVSCYQLFRNNISSDSCFSSVLNPPNFHKDISPLIVGVPGQAEKDEIVKSVMELKSMEIEEGYTLDAVVSRQDLLMDVRDKLLFEPEYAGNARERVPPKSSLRIPWAWLPGALCLLQEAGEEKLVLEIGRAALQHPDAKPYIHDLLLSMALAECSIAKSGFEKGKVSQGFEALARAQYLLRNKISLGKMPLLTQIEESLEELAPSCTLELLSMPHTPENAERRRGAIAALRELLRQGLEVETFCRVQDWPCFFGQALCKLMATEIVDLLPWDTLALTRKNRKSLESQNQRVVIDFNCFYRAMLAHIALGFSSKQMTLINKSRIICECLEASEGINLKLEEALCSFLLGQGGEMEAVENLRQLEINGNPSSQSLEPSFLEKEHRDDASMRPSLEKWLEDAVLAVFPDTRDCSPSLAIFFGGDKKTHTRSKQKKVSSQTISNTSHRSPSLVPPFDKKNGASEHNLLQTNLTRHLGAAVKQLAPANLQSQPTAGKTPGSNTAPSVQMKRNFGMNHRNVLDSWWASCDTAGRIALLTATGCFVLATIRLLSMQFGQRQSPHKWYYNRPKLNATSSSWTVDPFPGHKTLDASIDGDRITGRLCNLFASFKKQLCHSLSAGTGKEGWLIDDLSSPYNNNPVSAGNMLRKRQMPHEEAEAVVKQWQAIKAEALGPNHQVHCLPKILAESMLAQWQDLADCAKSSSCFWRFVLLQLSVIRADIVSDEIGQDMAEIDAVLEEAAELVDESQPKNPNYYSKYQIRYILKRQSDGSWRICGGGIQTPA